MSTQIWFTCHMYQKTTTTKAHLVSRVLKFGPCTINRFIMPAYLFGFKYIAQLESPVERRSQWPKIHLVGSVPTVPFSFISWALSPEYVLVSLLPQVQIIFAFLHHFPLFLCPLSCIHVSQIFFKSYSKLHPTSYLNSLLHPGICVKWEKWFWL